MRVVVMAMVVVAALLVVSGVEASLDGLKAETDYCIVGAGYGAIHKVVCLLPCSILGRRARAQLLGKKYRVPCVCHHHHQLGLTKSKI